MNTGDTLREMGSKQVAVSESRFSLALASKILTGTLLSTPHETRIL
jgi:hypothetical protein